MSCLLLYLPRLATDSVEVTLVRLRECLRCRAGAAWALPCIATRQASSNASVERRARRTGLNAIGMGGGKRIEQKQQKSEAAEEIRS